ncbi:MAG: hypothetical protein JNJ60_09595 [Rhodocyclaceae bacterium]|nr:hypothetical protein [Rhodocyclaceae bacterium]
MDLVREPALQGLADAEVGMLAQLAQQVVCDAMSRGRADLCFHHMRLTAWRLLPARRPGRRSASQVAVELWLHGPLGLVARTRLVVRP